MADVNGDGFLDLYVCKSGSPEGNNRHNELFINNGDHTFSEKAEEYGIVMKRNKPGGYNVPMMRGIGGWTAIFDFSGLYPNLASAANAGIDTLIQVKHPLVLSERTLYL